MMTQTNKNTLCQEETVLKTSRSVIPSAFHLLGAAETVYAFSMLFQELNFRSIRSIHKASLLRLTFHVLQMALSTFSLLSRPIIEHNPCRRLDFFV